MDKPTRKFSAIVNGDLPSGVIANTLLHLGAQLGAMAPDLAGRACKDASGLTHSGIPIYPNVILAATTDQLKMYLADAYRVADTTNLIVLDYTELGYSTTTETEYQAAMNCRTSDSMVYYAILIFGDRRVVNKLTKGLTLWSNPSS